MSALIFTARGNLWNRIPSLSLWAQPKAVRACYSHPHSGHLEEADGTQECRHTSQHHTRKSPLRFLRGAAVRPSGSECKHWTCYPAPHPVAEVCNPCSSSLSTGFTSLSIHLCVCLSLLFLAHSHEKGSLLGCFRCSALNADERSSQERKSER